MFAFIKTWRERSRRPRKIDDEPPADLGHLADLLADLVRDATASQAFDAQDIECAESTAFRLLKRLRDHRSVQPEGQSPDFASPGSGLARALLSWLAQPAAQVPAELTDALQTLTSHAERLTLAARDALATHPALGALQIVPAPGDPVQDIGRAALRALKGSDPGSLEERSQRLSEAVQSLTLWPADVSTASRTDVETAAVELGHLAERIASLRGLYERARRLEISAENLRTWATNLDAILKGAKVPRQVRRASVGPALSTVLRIAQERAALGRFASTACRYALSVFGFLQEKWGSAFAAGASLLIPAALLKQLVASAATVDVSWASTLSKLDPVDGFKLPLVALLIITCLATVWLSFRRARLSVLAQLESDISIPTIGRNRDAGVFILRNTTVAALSVVAIYSGVALWIWSGGPGKIIPSVKADPVAGPSAAATIGTSDTAQGFAPVLTFGDVRVIRCVIERCTFGTQTIDRGKTISLPNDRTLAETEAAAFEDRYSAILLENGPRTWDVPPTYSIDHSLDLSGSVSVTGIPALDLSPVTLTIDNETAATLGNAIGAAFSRVRPPVQPSHIQLEIPDELSRTLNELGSWLLAEPAWRSGLLATFDRSAAADEALATIARQRQACESARYHRGFGERFHDGITGYACPPDH